MAAQFTVLQDVISSYLSIHAYSFYFKKDKTQVFILFKSEKKMTSSVVVHVDRKKMDTRHLNAYTYSFCPNGNLVNMYSFYHRNR